MAQPKKPATPVISYPAPRTFAELGEYELQIEKDIADLNARESALNQAIKTLKAHAETELAPIRAKIVARATAGHAFAEANRKTLLRGDSKTVTFPHGADMRWYDSPGSVSVTSSIKKVLAKIREMGLADKFIRLVPSLDKDEILSTPENRALASSIKGIKIRYGEFFAFRFGDTRVVKDNVGDWSIETEKSEALESAEAA